MVTTLRISGLPSTKSTHLCKQVEKQRKPLGQPKDLHPLHIWARDTFVRNEPSLVPKAKCAIA